MNPRERAALNGHKTYTGSACRVCNGTLRYTNNWSCVQCACSRQPTKERSARHAVPDRDQERRDMRARLALRRAEQSAKQRRAMGLPG